MYGDFFNVYLLILEREHVCVCVWKRVWGVGAEADSSQADSLLRRETDSGLDPSTLKSMAWAETKSQLPNQLGHPGVPVWRFL